MWFAITLIIFIATGALLTVASVDEPRKPVTLGLALTNLLLSSAIIAGIAHYFL